MKEGGSLRVRLGMGLVALVLQLPFAAVAADQVVAVNDNAEHISIYAKPYDAKAQGKMAVKEVKFPLPVLAADGDFLQVVIAGKKVWLDGSQVAIGKPVEYACVKAERPPARTASIQGASAGCK